MVHLGPLPGSPFDEGLTRDSLLARARRDLDALLEAGFDAVSISNEADRPYLNAIPPEQIALFTYIVARLTERLEIPFGCGMLMDARATLAVAKAVGAAFARVTYGVTAGTFGFHSQAPGELLRYRRQIGATDIRLFVNVLPYLGTSLDQRSGADVLAAAAAWTNPDALQIGSYDAGGSDVDLLREVRALVPTMPLVVAGGVTAASTSTALEVADAVIVGTSLKLDGEPWNPIDPARATAFMSRVREARGY